MTEEQLRKLNVCHFDYRLEQRCEELFVPARNLLSSSRFDLYAILLYIDHRVRGVKDMSYALNVYKERTRVITAYKFSEEGNNEKNSFMSFVNTLDKLIEDFQNDDFDEERTLVPVDKDYELMDGAHRVACAAYFGKKIKILRFVDMKVDRMSSSYFVDNLMPIEVADALALESTRWHDNMFMLFLWPKSFDDMSRHQRALEVIRSSVDVMYEKESQMTYMAIRNLMLQLYGHMDWVGTIDNDFESTYRKADAVWSEHGKCRFILMTASSTEFVLELKSKIREIFGIGLASIHSTDNMRETLLGANALFNPNGFQFLHIAQPTKYKKAYKTLEAFKEAIVSAGKTPNDYIVDSSMVLAIIGSRPARDLDYYVLSGEESLRIENSEIEEHDDSQKQYYNNSIDDLIIVPENHFCFNEVKFVSLNKLLMFKQNRFAVSRDEKDSDDIKIIKGLLSGKKDRIGQLRLNATVTVKRWRRLTKDWLYVTRNKILQKIGLYNILKQIRDVIRQKGNQSNQV